MSTTNTPGPRDTSSAGDKAKQAASSATEDVKHRARDVADTVASEAASYADRARTGAAEEVKGVASALRTAADELRSGSPQERTFSQIADGLADASDAMRDKDLGEIVSSLNGFARRNPLIFLGGAALVGFAATRFAKASGRHAAGSARSDFSSSRTTTNAEQGIGRPTQSPPSRPATPGGQL